MATPRSIARWPSIATVLAVLAASFGAVLFTAPRAAATTFVSGAITVDTTWGALDNEYILVADVIVRPGVRLTILPGTTVRINPNHALFVEGELRADGQPGNEIFFLQNNTISLMPPLGIQFNASARGSVTFSVIDRMERGVTAVDSSPDIADNIIFRTSSAVALQNSFATVQRNYINNTVWGIYVLAGGQPYVADNGIANVSGPFAIGIYVTGGANADLWRNTISRVQGRGGPNAGFPGAPGADGGPAIGILVESAPSAVVQGNVISQVYGGLGGAGMEDPGGSGGRGGDGGPGAGIVTGGVTDSDIDGNTILSIYGGRGGNGGGAATTSFGGAGGRGGDAAGVETVFASGAAWWYSNWIDGATAGVGGNGADAIVDGLGGTGGDAYGIFGIATTNPDASGNILQNLRGGLGGNSTNSGNGNNNGGPGGTASGVAFTGFTGSATIHTNSVSTVTGGQGGRGSTGGRGGNATGAFTIGQAAGSAVPTFVTSNWVQSITGGEGALGARTGGDGGMGSGYISALVTPFLGANGAWTIAGGDGGDAIDGNGGGRGGDATGFAAYLVSGGWSASDWLNTVNKGAVGVGPPAQVSYATGFYMEGNATITTTFTIENATIGGIGGAGDREIWANFNAVGTTINTPFQGSKVMVDASSTLYVKNFLSTEVYWPDGFTPVAGANILVTEDGATVWSFTSATGFDQWLLTLDRTYKGSTTATDVVNDVAVSYLAYAFASNPRTVDMFASNAQPFVMIDGDAPTSSADALPAYTASLSFGVNYTASDGGGVGLSDISLWFRRDAGPWTLFATQFAGNFGTFAFVAPGDGTYQFETTATDLAGNAEPGPSTNESWTIVDTTGPGSRVNALPTWQTSLSFPVSWAPDPGVTDIRTYTIQYNRGFGWNNWLVDTTQTSGNFLALFQSVYQFRAIATDYAGNVETASTNDTWTIVDTVHPVSFTAPLPVYETTLTFPVSWEPEADDVATFQIDVRDNGGAWTTWIASTPLRTGNYTGQDGHTYEFRAIATDFAGNVENQPAGNESWTIVDVTSPLSFVAPLPAWRTSLTFTVNWAPEAGVTDIATYRIDVNDNGTGWTTVVASTAATSGSFTGQDGHTYAFRSLATDRAGNVEAPGGADATTTVDVSAPTSSSSRAGTLGNSNWYVTDVTVTLSATDATSGVAGITFSVDGNTWTTYSAPIVVTGEGFHKVEFRASDNAGNLENVRSTSFNIDLAPPTTSASLIGTAGDNGWHTSPIAVSLSATDTASGVASIAYRVDGGAWSTYAAPFSVSTDGSHTVDFQATDNAGLVEAVGSRTFRIDATDPLVLNTAPRGANTNTTPRIVITFSEAMNRTTVELAFALNPDVSGTFLWSADSTSVTFTPDQALDPGTSYFVSVVQSAKDMAGNTLPQTVTFSFTTAAPPPGGNGFEVGGLWWLIIVVAAILGSLFLLRGRFPVPAKAAPVAAAKPEDQAMVDDVFLLYHDGILIKHETRRLKPDIDTDILSGMLTAVQSFVKDSFRSEEGHLDEMTFGAMHILIGRGKWLILAAMVQGDTTDSMRKQMQKAIEDMEAHHADVVEGWDGNMTLAKTLSPYIKKLIRGDYA